ncbi:ThiF family adenylyltransferase [Gorillibacterium sp. sgz5001074]|uniref:ThiF family adenylyltransferase n=1 Tax=Gorillibacterium sp. sgz5001074 TaxID=3446695 RepID=UPI003F676A78
MTESMFPPVPSRYSRQLLFAPIGEEGQRRLMNARVAIVGMGALGTVLANHMVRAGVGYVRIIDRDFVEESNLQRQMLYVEADAAESKPKAAAAAERLGRINSLVRIEAHVADLNPSNAEELLTGVDLVLDGSDNFSVRFLVNDVCVKHRIPWIYGGAVSSRGVVMPILPGETPCLRCMFGNVPEQGTAETCDTAGVIGPIIHIVASYQATEALKLLTGSLDKVNRSMQHMDLWNNHYGSVDISGGRQADCPCCSSGRYEFLTSELEGESIQSLCGRNSVQIVPVRSRKLDLTEWETTFRKLGPTERNPFLLKFQPSPDLTLVLFPDGRAMIQGTSDLTAAKTLYSKYVGM